MVQQTMVSTHIIYQERYGLLRGPTLACQGVRPSANTVQFSPRTRGPVQPRQSQYKWPTIAARASPPAKTLI